jgi:hypothetical protein
VHYHLYKWISFWTLISAGFFGKERWHAFRVFHFGLSDNGNWLHETTKRLLDSVTDMELIPLSIGKFQHLIQQTLQIVCSSLIWTLLPHNLVWRICTEKHCYLLNPVNPTAVQTR